MRFALLFPPSLCLPNQLYYALPMLAGALERAGHEPQITDLNLLAADRILEPTRLLGFFGRASEAARELARAGHREASKSLIGGLAEIEPRIARSLKVKSVLRDPRRYFDPATFREAFQDVVDILAFHYQLDPVISPHDAHFRERLSDFLRVDPWTPLRDLYDEELLDAVLARDPEAVGICVAFPEQGVDALRLLRALRRRRPDLHLCVGGPLITQFAERWLADGWLLDHCDSVCIGDGETALVELCEALEGRRPLDSVRNLWRRDAQGHLRQPAGPPQLERFEELPSPRFESADLRMALTPEPIYPLMLSRGCYWGRCTFCSIGWRENYRAAAEAKIAADARELARRYGARYVQLQDSSVPPRAARLLAETIASEDLGLYWVGGFKLERCLLEEEYCRTLAAGGCRSLQIGLESASQRVLDRMDKGYRAADAPRMLANLHRAGIAPELLWFVGFPTETRAEALETLEFLDRHRDLYGLSAFVSTYQLHPDTIVYERPADFGVEVTAEVNGACSYIVESGMQMAELPLFKRLLAETNNRTLICNGSHLPHRVERGVATSEFGRSFVLPPELREFCSAETDAAALRELARREGAPSPELDAPRSPAPIEARGPLPRARQRFYDQDFGFRSRLEAAWRDVREECDALSLEELRSWPEDGAVSGAWGVYAFCLAEEWIEEHERRCPRTAALLRSIDGLYTAGFSLLGPRSRLPLHFGESQGVLRCHLALRVPEGCGLRVGLETMLWEEGRSFVFDDAVLHTAWNQSEQPKAILLLDFAPPSSEGIALEAPSAELAMQRQIDRAYYRMLR
ncbi:MAG: aspartyl/asparaginyl beta-hydroxylase domain-containing protein [Planctomycetes bacterium]|nr:aspartyl/asparaginyl beta-hydroxylase domain-containing protein [Planctomycetota bacterium]